ncbi:DUF4393 domain-containing protein [Autumnicola psychrophila]|uniref:DUF4393 domain-containing protein n=1 Tax=Autumnicola psychrophila TaxID=3075592 RepID=A0ABU3DND8_9FLAO|nr:DUF4393 domain-containing protein [Zunongwangia sp. F225]MDT0685235.1 DUF4393 domain-containing protein [Zunongwangia sp. F225]
MSDEESNVNALIHLGQGKLVSKLYQDLLSKPSKKAGQALGTIVNVSNTVLWPIKWFNERTRLYFENNLKKYEEKLEKVPEEEITPVPTEISNPILDRFSYVSNKELSDAFVKLLASASSSKKAKDAHPGFIQIIDRISPDEARILKYLATAIAIPVVDIKHHNNPDNSTQYRLVIKGETGLKQKLILNWPDNLPIYFNNLESLGLISRKPYYLTILETKFETILEDLDPKLKKVFENYNEEELREVRKEDKGMYEKTNFGNMFIRACIRG